MNEHSVSAELKGGPKPLPLDRPLHTLRTEAILNDTWSPSRQICDLWSWHLWIKSSRLGPAAFPETEQNVSGVIKAGRNGQDSKVVGMRVMDYFEVRGTQAVIWTQIFPVMTWCSVKPESEAEWERKAGRMWTRNTQKSWGSKYINVSWILLSQFMKEKGGKPMKTWRYNFFLQSYI